MPMPSSRTHRLHTPTPAQSFLPRVEQLEPRCLPSADNRLFVATAYQDLVQHSIPGDRLTQWTRALDQGVSRLRIVAQIEASPQYQPQLVRQLYRYILHEQADAAALTSALTFLAAGGSIDQLRVRLYASPRYFERRGSGTNDGFLRALSRDLLGRRLTPHDQQLYAPQLLADGSSKEAETARRHVVSQITATDRARLVLVQQLLQRFLHQTTDATATRLLFEKLKHGAGLERLIAVLISSQEYLLLRFPPTPSGSSPPLQKGSPIVPAGPSAPVNVAVTTDPGVQQMPSVAVDPLDAKHVVIAYMDRSLVSTGYAGIGVAVSHDGGSTWQHSAVPLPAKFDQGAANPIARFDDQGHVFVSFMAATFLGPQPALTNGNFEDRGLPGIQSNSGIFVARSDDGGLTWKPPAAVVSHLYDGEHQVFFEVIPDLAIDTFRSLPNGQPNPHYGDQYVAWTRIYSPGQFPGEADSTGGTDAMIAVSRDGGHSWQTQLENVPGIPTPVTVIQDSLNLGVGAPLGLGILDQVHLAIGPEGDIYVTNAGGGDFTVHHSTDGSASFDPPDHTTGRRIAFGTSETTIVNEQGLPTNHFRTFPMRAIVADPTRPGNVYVADAELITDLLGNPIDAADIIFARSTDYGVSWQTSFQIGSTPAHVLNDDNGGQSATGLSTDEVISGQALPRLAIDAQGRISLIWYDTRRDPANHLLDVFGTTSTDGGKTFSPNFRVTEQSFDADRGKFTDATGKDDYYLGDYLGLALANNTAYAAWTDTRAGNQDVFFSRYPITPAPAPPNDRFEPNDTAATATDLGTVIKRTVPRLAIPPGDEDWFRVQAASTGDLTVSALQSDPGRQLRLELRDASGQTLLAGGTDVLDSDGNVTGQQLVFPGHSGTSYLVHVLPASGGRGSGAYSLQLQSLTADLGTIVHNVSSGQFASGDQAYYLLVAGAAGSFEVQLTSAANLQGALNLELLDADKLTVLATGTASGPPAPGAVEQASVAIKQGQPILVHVSGAAGTHGDYTLEATNLDQFATPENASLFFPAGAGPSQLAVGDLNGDGKPDLVVADALSNTLSVLLGNGDGTFQAPRQFAVGAFKTPNPQGVEFHLPTFRRQVVLVDLNHDGKLDAVVTNYDSGDVSVLLGRGDGTFESQRRFDATAAPFDVAVGDVNGDGTPDLVAVSADSSGTSTVAVLLGRGDGTFQPQRTFTVRTGGDLPFSTVKIADLNQDGKADLVFSGSGESKLTVFLGNGDGTFQRGTDFPASRLGTGLAIADANGDGILDIITTALDPGGLAVLLGKGDGIFTPLVNPNTGLPGFLAGQNPVAVAVADVGSAVTQPDGSTTLGPPDGYPDLIVAASGVFFAQLPQGPPGVFVLPALTDAQGHFAGFGLPLELAPADAPQDVVVADLNGDGVPDVVALDRQGVFVHFGKHPALAPNDSPQTARKLGTVVHLVEPTLTIVPGHADAYYKLTVPTEAARGVGAEVLDFSGLFQATEGAGLSMDVHDAAGNLLGSGPRFRAQAAQGATLTLHVFGVTGSGGQRGAGAYTLDIDTLPQVVSVEAQPLLPGVGGKPGGPTASIVLTLQGDRLDPASAQNPANYTVTWLGPDGIAGTADDQVIPLAAGQGIVYDPSTNVDVGSGKNFPTAVRQTVTLLFSQSLPTGSYRIDLAPAIKTAAFNVDEAQVLVGAVGFTGHPVVSVQQGQINEGSRRLATDLVFAAGALGNFSVWKNGTPFLSQLHDDLSALLDGQLTQSGDAAGITAGLLQHVKARLGPALGAPGQRPTGVLALVLDPVSLDLVDSSGHHVTFDLNLDSLVNTFPGAFVDVIGNIEVIVLSVLNGQFTLHVSNVPGTSRGGVVILGAQADQQQALTDALRAGTTDFTFTIPS